MANFYRERYREGETTRNTARFNDLVGTDESHGGYGGNRSDFESGRYAFERSYDYDRGKSTPMVYGTSRDSVKLSDKYNVGSRTQASSRQETFKLARDEINVSATKKLLTDIQKSIMGFQKIQKTAEDAGKKSFSSDQSLYDRDFRDKSYSVRDERNERFDYKPSGDTDLRKSGHHESVYVSGSGEDWADDYNKKRSYNYETKVRSDNWGKSDEDRKPSYHRYESDVDRLNRNRAEDAKSGESQKPREKSWNWLNPVNLGKIEMTGQGFYTSHRQATDTHRSPHGQATDTHRSPHGQVTDTRRSPHGQATDTRRSQYKQVTDTHKSYETYRQSDVSTAAGNSNTDKKDWQKEMWDFIKKSQNKKTSDVKSGTADSGAREKTKDSSSGTTAKERDFMCRFCNFQCRDEQRWNAHINGLQHRTTMTKLSKNNQRKTSESQKTRSESIAAQRTYEKSKQSENFSEKQADDERNHRNVTSTSKSSPGKGRSVPMGDWYCPEKKCQAHNYSHRQTCFKCHAKKPEGKDNTKDGYWLCPKIGCNAHNYAHRVTCFRCKIPKPKTDDQQQGSLRSSSNQQHRKSENLLQIKTTDITQHSSGGHRNDSSKSTNVNPAKKGSEERVTGGLQRKSHHAQNPILLEDQELDYEYESSDSEEGQIMLLRPDSPAADRGRGRDSGGSKRDTGYDTERESSRRDTADRESSNKDKDIRHGTDRGGSRKDTADREGSKRETADTRRGTERESAKRDKSPKQKDRTTPSKQSAKEQAKQQEDQAMKIREITKVVEQMNITATKKENILSSLKTQIKENPELKLETLKNLTKTFMLLQDSEKSSNSASSPDDAKKSQKSKISVKDVAAMAIKLMTGQEQVNIGIPVDSSGSNPALSETMQSKLGTPLLSVQNQKLGQIQNMIPQQNLLGMAPGTTHMMVPPGMLHSGPQLPIVRGQSIPFSHMGYSMGKPGMTQAMSITRDPQQEATQWTSMPSMMSLSAEPLMVTGGNINMLSGLNQPFAQPSYQMTAGTAASIPFPHPSMQQSAVAVTREDHQSAPQTTVTDPRQQTSSSAQQQKVKNEMKKPQQQSKHRQNKGSTMSRNSHKKDVEKDRKMEQNKNQARSVERTARNQSDERRHHHHEDRYSGDQKQSDIDRKQIDRRNLHERERAETQRPSRFERDQAQQEVKDDYSENRPGLYSEGRFREYSRRDGTSPHNRENPGHSSRLDNRKRAYDESFPSAMTRSHEREQQAASAGRENSRSFGTAETMAKKRREEIVRDTDLRQAIFDRKESGHSGDRESGRQIPDHHDRRYPGNRDTLKRGGEWRKLGEQSSDYPAAERDKHESWDYPNPPNEQNKHERLDYGNPRQAGSPGRKTERTFGIAEMVSKKRREEADRKHDGSNDRGGRQMAAHQDHDERAETYPQSTHSLQDRQFHVVLGEAVNKKSGGQFDHPLDMTEEERALVKQVQLMTGMNDPVKALEAVRMVTSNSDPVPPPDTPVSDRPHRMGQDVYKGSNSVHDERPATQHQRHEEAPLRSSHVRRQPQHGGEGHVEQSDMVREVMEMTGTNDMEMVREAVEIVHQSGEQLKNMFGDMTDREQDRYIREAGWKQDQVRQRGQRSRSREYRGSDFRDTRRKF